jgi:hypothetical protein
MPPVTVCRENLFLTVILYPRISHFTCLEKCADHFEDRESHADGEGVERIKGIRFVPL